MYNWKSLFNSDTLSFVTVYNDGTTKNLMSLTGTIPAEYDGNKPPTGSCQSVIGMVWI